MGWVEHTELTTTVIFTNVDIYLSYWVTLNTNKYSTGELLQYSLIIVRTQKLVEQSFKLGY